ncbi:hypothetical protein O181_091602 [Austropuccinia psidii MF-1]|uniref:Uncharacterized protein n=1 Tax=Austropuccinia psidii MF-1 TaxID=1389203 RepID=A0A9Q3P8T4_9BASI|nr:hypothetical protein [Austropuccinia psidii MF-1]
MKQGEPNLPKTQDLQVIHGGSTEGEDSPEVHHVSGAITSFMGHTRSLISGSKTFLGPNQKSMTSPSTPRSHSFNGPEPFLMGQNGQFCCFRPPGTPANLGPGGLQ